MKKSILTSIALVLVAFAANAQVTATPVQHSVKVIASPVLDISMTSLDDVVFAFDTPEKYEGGITKNAATQLKVKSTKAWTVKATSGTATAFTSASGNNNSEILVDKLEIGATVFIPAVAEVVDGSGNVIVAASPASFGSATFAPLATSPGTTVKTGVKGGNATTGNTFSLDYKLNPGYIAQDNYEMVVTYTISQN